MASFINFMKFLLLNLFCKKKLTNVFINSWRSILRIKILVSSSGHIYIISEIFFLGETNTHTQERGKRVLAQKTF